MQIIYLLQQVGSFGAKGVISILEIRGSIPTNDIVCLQHWNVDKIFTTYVANLG